MNETPPKTAAIPPQKLAGRAYDLRARLISAAVMAPIALLCLVLGQAPFAVFVAIGAVLILREWVRMVNTAQAVPALAAGSAAVLAAMAAAYLMKTDLSLAILAVGAGCVAALSPLRRLWAASGVFYAGIAAVALVHLRGLEQGLGAIVFLFAVIWLTDIAAYAGGRTIGGPKLWPAVSPKKTWAGFFSGLAGAAGGGVLAVLISGPAARFGASWTTVVMLAIAVSIAGQLGDLFESFMKRHFGVKDSGTLIPGHGGAMDRLDSLVTAASLAAIIAFCAGLPRIFMPFYWSAAL